MNLTMKNPLVVKRLFQVLTKGARQASDLIPRLRARLPLSSHLSYPITALLGEFFAEAFSLFWVPQFLLR
ncbi:MAG: hypothetical protein DSO08_00505 [Candidatus Methanomethylicota archaeon]|jgi:hypothetical protein|uniref:Uncharacterized protein n=1 Tax=Thermoproteota archaeon TaxID=2056631 RepID=A0A523BGU5_9CREN|nr:MAG: hypothetical protein DSO08_00505 [Candidatus Verstraetearchaeota archaeon]